VIIPQSHANGRTGFNPDNTFFARIVDADLQTASEIPPSRLVQNPGQEPEVLMVAGVATSCKIHAGGAYPGIRRLGKQRLRWTCSRRSKISAIPHQDRDAPRDNLLVGRYPSDIAGLTVPGLALPKDLAFDDQELIHDA